MAATKKDFPRRALSGRDRRGHRSMGGDRNTGPRRSGSRGGAGDDGPQHRHGNDRSARENPSAGRPDTGGRDFPYPVEVAVEDTRVAAYEREAGRTEGRNDALDQEPALGPGGAQGGAEQGAQPREQNADKKRASQGQDSAWPIQAALGAVGEVAMGADISADRAATQEQSHVLS